MRPLPLLLLFACGPQDAGHAGPVELTTDAGLYDLVLTAEPDPPVSGAASLTVEVSTAADGAPVEGADIAVEPMMPAMGHGIATPPEVVEQGGGVYVATWAYSMPGVWELTLTVDAAAGGDAAVVSYDVE